MHHWKLDIGASVIDKDRVNFRVWAPGADTLSVKITSANNTRLLPLIKDTMGYFQGITDNVRSGDRYLYVLNNASEYPDPASRFQPDGVHAPSQVAAPHEFQWEDSDWKGVPLRNFMIYELHVGTFTQEGTFESIISCIDYFREVGITAIELMPVAQFPGSRNWGYDGVYLFAPQNSYGGPAGLKKLVNACHIKGLAVILDVVYNHLGPEGNYLGNFGPYFTNRYKTPWGEAINFDGPYSDQVRQFFIDNALYWITEYHIDALRIDAVHGIFDFSARHFLRDLGDAVHRQAEALARDVYVIPESDLNDVRIINPVEMGGYGLDAQWNDDFHHALHVLLTDELKGYYEDFGGLKHMEKAFRDGFVYSGQYSSFRKRRHGSSSKDRPSHQFIVFSQNHDQVGNRMMGDRMSQTQSLEKLKLAAGVVILSPYIPLLFMGEEYGETAPFQYFVSHSDKALMEAVRNGRSGEFATFEWDGEIPDPQAESTFLNSKLHIQLHTKGKHAVLFKFYKELIRLRREIPAFFNLSREDMEVTGFREEKVLCVKRWFKDDAVLCLYNFNNRRSSITLTTPEGRWEKMLDSSSREWSGKGEPSAETIKLKSPGVAVRLNPHSFVIYRHLREVPNGE